MSLDFNRDTAAAIFNIAMIRAVARTPGIDANAFLDRYQEQVQALLIESQDPGTQQIGEAIIESLDRERERLNRTPPPRE